MTSDNDYPADIVESLNQMTDGRVQAFAIDIHRMDIQTPQVVVTVQGRAYTLAVRRLLYEDMEMTGFNKAELRQLYRTLNKHTTPHLLVKFPGKQLLAVRTLEMESYEEFLDGLADNIPEEFSPEVREGCLGVSRPPEGEFDSEEKSDFDVLVESLIIQNAVIGNDEEV